MELLECILCMYKIVNKFILKMYGFEIEYLMLAKSFHLKTEILCKLEPDACASPNLSLQE